MRKHLPNDFTNDLYYALLATSWPRFIFLYLAFFFSINLFFGICYFLIPSGVSGGDGSFLSCFFFSVHTFSTVGYGSLSPGSLTAHWLVVIEVIVGLLSVALTTGLFFAKFSLPTAKIMLTKNLVLAKRDGLPNLMFRIANARTIQLVNATLELMVLWPEQTAEGETVRRFIDLPLTRKRTPIFSMSWIAFHPIDDKSVLFGLSEKDIRQKNLEFFVSVSGADGLHGQNVYTSQMYKASDIIWDRYFMDMVNVHPDGTREVDYSKFNLLKP